MLKRLAIVIFLASVLPIPGHCDGPHSNGDQTNANASKQPSPPIVQCTVKQDASSPQCNWAESVPEGYFSRLFTVENTPNIALSIVGIIGIGIALSTVRAIQKQAVAQMEADRAWMIPKISQPEHKDVTSPDEKGDDWKLPIQVEITNLGKTPAVVINAAFNFYSEKIADATEQTLVLDLPEIPAYSHDPTPYAPGAIYVTKEATSLPLGIPKSFLLAERAAWTEKKKCLCLRGYINYVDAFKKPHITRFCYAYQEVWSLKAMRYEIRNERGPEFEFRKVNPDVYNEMT